MAAGKAPEKSHLHLPLRHVSRNTVKRSAEYVLIKGLARRSGIIQRRTPLGALTDLFWAGPARQNRFVVQPCSAPPHRSRTYCLRVRHPAELLPGKLEATM